MKELLTTQELEAMDMTAQLANKIHEIIGDGPTASADWSEAAAEIHVIQHRIMAQAAARAYPERFRLMGRTIRRIGGQ